MRCDALRYIAADGSADVVGLRQLQMLKLIISDYVRMNERENHPKLAKA
jgi:hypothetical protein